MIVTDRRDRSRRRHRHHHRVPGNLPGSPALNEPDPIMLTGLSELGQAYLSILNVYSLAYGLERRAARHHRRLPARTVGHAVHRAVDDADHQDGAQRRHPDPDLLLCRNALWRIAHRDPAQHSRHRGQRGVLRRRPCAGVARRSRPRHRHCDLGRLQRHAVRRAVPRGVHAAARRGLAVVRRLRILLAGAARRRDVRQHRRQRSAQGLADGHARPVRGADRPGGPLCP